MPALTVRTRLTLLYAALFLAAGTLLTVVLALSVRDALYADPNKSDLAKMEALTDGASKVDKAEAFEQVRAQVREQTMGRLARVRRVTAAARLAGDANLKVRLDLRGPRDEIKDLGDTFDTMLARLDEAFDAQRRFVANASHELRTPLAATLTAVEVTLAKPHATEAQLRTMGQEVCGQMARARRLVDSLLVLGRSGQRVVEVEVDDLADFAAEALDLVRHEAAALGLRVRAELCAAPAAGDVALLSRAVANLVENAVRHNRPHGEVTVASGVEDGRSWVRVGNTGADLSDVDLDRLFEPFNRGVRTRLNGTGAGLGLSIVAAVARVHGGTVQARARPAAQGGGLLVTLRLPGADDLSPP
jgi:signal transduction histidine kinase